MLSNAFLVAACNVRQRSELWNSEAVLYSKIGQFSEMSVFARIYRPSMA